MRNLRKTYCHRFRRKHAVIPSRKRIADTVGTLRKAQMVVPPWHIEICCRPERQQLRLERYPLSATVSPPLKGVAREARPVGETASGVRRRGQKFQGACRRNFWEPQEEAFAGANGRGEALFSGGYHRLFAQEQRDGGTYSMHRLARLAKQAKAVCLLRKTHAAAERR